MHAGIGGADDDIGRAVAVDITHARGVPAKPAFHIGTVYRLEDQPIQAGFAAQVNVEPPVHSLFPAGADNDIVEAIAVQIADTADG